MNFDQAFDLLIDHEGGYSNNPTDPGGETMWGVTLRVAREAGYQGAMRDLPKDTAKAIYRAQYWSPVKAELLPPGVRYDVFDGAVNSGPRQSIKWLQAAAGVATDGIIGPATLLAVTAKASKLPALYNAARLQFMTDLPTWGSFGKGWARRIATNLRTGAKEI